MYKNNHFRSSLISQQNHCLGNSQGERTPLSLPPHMALTVTSNTPCKPRDISVPKVRFGSIKMALQFSQRHVEQHHTKARAAPVAGCSECAVLGILKLGAPVSPPPSSFTTWEVP